MPRHFCVSVNFLLFPLFPLVFDRLSLVSINKNWKSPFRDQQITFQTVTWWTRCGKWFCKIDIVDNLCDDTISHWSFRLLFFFHCNKLRSENLFIPLVLAAAVMNIAWYLSLKCTFEYDENHKENIPSINKPLNYTTFAQQFACLAPVFMTFDLRNFHFSYYFMFSLFAVENLTNQ